MVERPVECSHCQKPIEVIYKEIVQSTTQCTEMCSDCPLFQQRLHPSPAFREKIKDAESGLCCHRCRTSLEAIKMGNPLGCSECYAIFSDLLMSELIKSNKIPKNRHAQLLHLGKTPNYSADIPVSSKIPALNEALNEALNKENYEQAAWLRDQINALIQKEAK